MLSSRPTLRGRGLSHSYGKGEVKTIALCDVTLDLHRGQVTLLIGPSGSGKSTLLLILSGLLRPENGTVLALEEDLWAMPDHLREQFRLRHCGFVFQGFNLFGALTARQQLEMILRWGEGVTGREARRRSVEMLDILGLGGKTELRPSQLSGGEKQRVAIGRALCKNPDFCFADEPTSALDWAHGEQVVDLLRSAARDRQATVLIVSHDPRLIPYADQVVKLGLTDSKPAHQRTASSKSSPLLSRLDDLGVY